MWHLSEKNYLNKLVKKLFLKFTAFGLVSKNGGLQENVAGCIMKYCRIMDQYCQYWGMQQALEVLWCAWLVVASLTRTVWLQVERARSELAERAAKLSAESESITLQLEEAELRASAAIKSATTMETQLSEAQAQLEEETRQKLALSSRLRQVESEMETIREQLEEEGDAKKKLESQVSQFSSI